MRRSNPKCSGARKQRRLSEAQEIQLLDSWIEAGIPDPGTNPLAISAPPPDAPIGRTKDGGFSPYAGVRFFRQLPISQRTKDGLAPKYVEMSDIQRASLPHSLCGRDILGAAKTGSGKTLAFVIPVRKPALVIEKLYRARWGPEDGVGGIIISPTKELAGQLFEELKTVGKSLLFLMPSEKEMFTKLRAVEPKIPIKLSTRILKKKKKLKINMHRPLGTRVKYDDDGNVIPPLAALADKETGDGSIDLGTVKERYEKLREAMKVRDKEDKLLHRQRLHDKRTKEKLKLKWKEEAEEGDDRSESDENEQRNPKRTKIYFDDDDNDEVDNAKAAKRSDAVALAEQEALALELLRSMHS
ncbi:hypothetical protein BHE74_00018967 [Ensete ventricosum]|nr:hypothetical protein BHE74_00018967 [Ensete ventricosum]